ncbi:hypothetical protein BU25DRAFT_414901 [Macroventuria anomochaeta]|uniref:Uncharacterized protein n=1 Tax=Macroventuria anomochaeta TaxID=301207 RepID=A0ACB6RLL7_9PLEO|nr:uncharacterized protein BU25DRAFT_414901 [Macroventuria anomochaeta]KAF2622911.1 hypothetical protein BU25DRAFT_414901 [Macroventuria anomochaeta]
MHDAAERPIDESGFTICNTLSSPCVAYSRVGGYIALMSAGSRVCADRTMSLRFVCLLAAVAATRCLYRRHALPRCVPGACHDKGNFVPRTCFQGCGIAAGPRPRVINRRSPRIERFFGWDFSDGNEWISEKVDILAFRSSRLGFWCIPFVPL